MLHIVAIKTAALAVKGLTVAGHALGHYWAGHTVAAGVAHAAAAHPLVASATAFAVTGGTVVTVAYLTKQELTAWQPVNAAAGGVTTINFSVAGKLSAGEFTPITGNVDSDTHILQGLWNQDEQRLLRHRVIRPTRIAPDLARSFTGGNLVLA